jgi:hypothetical protein
MVTKRTGRPRTGRPKKDGVVPFLQNPKRDSVRWLRATLEVMPQPSIRRASKLIAGIMFGNKIVPESLPPKISEMVANYRAKMIKAHGPGMILSFGPVGSVVHKADGKVLYKNTRRDCGAATIEGAAEFIRQLDRQATKEAETNPDVARWLPCAVRGLVLSMQGAPAAVVASIYRNSGDPELLASLDIPEQNLNLTARTFCTQASVQKM